MKATQLMLGALLGASVSVGCQDAVTSKPVPSEPAGELRYLSLPFGTPDGALVDATGAPIGQSTTSLEAIGLDQNIRTTFRMAVEAEPTLAEASSAVQARAQRFSDSLRLGKNDAMSRSIAAQGAAVALLVSSGLLERDLTAEEQAILARHTQTLVENHSPEALLVQKSLAKLKGYWSDDERRAAGSIVGQATRTYFEKRSECASCDETFRKSKPESFARLKAYEANLRTAADQLIAGEV